LSNNNKKDGETVAQGGLNRDEKSKEQFDKLDKYLYWDSCWFCWVIAFFPVLHRMTELGKPMAGSQWIPRVDLISG
jgi:hypothetical protein